MNIALILMTITLNLSRYFITSMGHANLLGVVKAEPEYPADSAALRYSDTGQVKSFTAKDAKGR